MTRSLMLKALPNPDTAAIKKALAEATALLAGLEPKDARRSAAQANVKALEEARKPFSYADSLRILLRTQVVKAQGGDGVSVGQMIDLMRCWTAVEKAEDGQLLVLDEDVWKALVAHLKRLDWMSFSPQMGEFLTDVTTAQKTKEGAKA